MMLFPSVPPPPPALRQKRGPGLRRPPARPARATPRPRHGCSPVIPAPCSSAPSPSPFFASQPACSLPTPVTHRTARMSQYSRHHTARPPPARRRPNPGAAPVSGSPARRRRRGGRGTFPSRAPGGPTPPAQDAEQRPRASPPAHLNPHFPHLAPRAPPTLPASPVGFSREPTIPRDQRSPILVAPTGLRTRASPCVASLS